MSLKIGGKLATHPQYDKYAPNWQKVDDVVTGDVDHYLRNVGCSESNAEKAEKRQREYIEGAILHNFTVRTRDGMQGAMFMKPPTINLTSQLEYLLDDCDGNGMNLEQQMQDSADQVLRKGRAGLLVDMSSVEEVPTIAQIESGEISPRIQMYIAQDIIDWKTVRLGSINRLCEIVLREQYDTGIRTGISDYTPNYQYRVLGLDENGFYYQEIWFLDKSDKLQQGISGNGEVRIYPVINGSKSREIPFYFIGADNNSYKVGTQPLLPIAELNIGHYRNSADTEENSFVCSQAMLIIALSDHISVKDFNDENPNGVQVGSRRGLNVGPSGSAMFIQAAESDKAMKLMERKEQQAVQLGAQLITPSQQVTAETARIQQGANGSVLSNISSNITDAYRKAVDMCGLFLGVTQASEVELSKDFFYQTLTAQERAQWVSEVMSGITPVELFYKKLIQTGQYPEEITKEEIESMLNDQQPMGGFAAEIQDDDIADGDE